MTLFEKSHILEHQEAQENRCAKRWECEAAALLLPPTNQPSNQSINQPIKAQYLKVLTNHSSVSKSIDQSQFSILQY